MGRLARKPCSCQLRGDSKFSLQIDSSEKVSRGEALGDVGDFFGTPNILGKASYANMLIAGKKLLWGVLRYINLRS